MGDQSRVCPERQYQPRALQLIVPCGIADKGVTSLERLIDRPIAMDEVADLTAEAFDRRLRPVADEVGNISADKNLPLTIRSWPCEEVSVSGIFGSDPVFFRHGGPRCVSRAEQRTDRPHAGGGQHGRHAISRRHTDRESTSLRSATLRTGKMPKR